MFKVGEEVTHKIFGCGVVISVDVLNKGMDSWPYFVEFRASGKGLHGGGFRGIFGKPGHCYWCCGADLLKQTVSKG